MNNFNDKIKEIDSYKSTIISGLNEGEKAFLPYFLSGKILIVCPNKENLLVYKETLVSLGKKVIFLEDKLPLLITLNQTKSNEFREYINFITRLVNRDYDIILITAQVLFQKFPSFIYFKKNIINLSKGEKLNQNILVQNLIDLGYVRNEIIIDKGEFTVRGDVVDVFPINHDLPIRINFFDDEIESINSFELNSYKLIQYLEKIQISCTNLLNLEYLKIQNIKESVKSDLQKLKLSDESMIRVSQICSQQLEYLEQKSSQISTTFFLPYCDYYSYSIFDYLEKNDTVIFDEPKPISDKIKLIYDDNINSFLDLSLSGEFLPRHQEFYIDKKDVFKKINDFRLIAYSRLISQNPIFKSQNLINFICPHIPRYINHFIELTEDVNNWKRNKNTILISCPQPIIQNKLKNFLNDKNISFVEINNIGDIQNENVNIASFELPYSSCFQMEKFICIGSKSLSNQLESIKKQSSQKPVFLPQIGDYVVHEIHGVGKCVGIKNLKLSSSFRDYIIIEYKDGDLLYLPSENVDMLTKYNQSTQVKLNKIGGTEFYKIKQKVKNSIKQMTFDLMKVYANRLNSKGFVYSKDSYLQKEFEASFPYEYTVDQVKALKEIKDDMESPRIMDRLLCGDVGFGKTEVALATAYKAIQDGKQVAIICPTTILCEQHYSTAISRMKDFMVNVACLNRFKTEKEKNEILIDLKEGRIDLICGTHSLLSKNVVFKDLGLLIIDEEQRFGVEDKEKLKNLKSNVDVLSLSATPIPRTLSMALSGIRDVSFLLTPPKERKKIKTNVIDYSDGLLTLACQKEIDRGGQVLIIYNRVDGITNFYTHVKSLINNVEIDYVHGQMPSKILEQKIYNLYSRKTQILISTVLIEQGIDLPYANTLFVIDADKLGLSQLYQLRGRIGRSNIEAYAYFSFSKDKVLTQDSYKRLDAIMEFNDFGSGYKIALRDLEIRGAGDVLGRVQHGHMQQVGYDLYVKLLNESLAQMRGENVEETREIKLDIQINSYLPKEYISINENRIEFYTKVSKIYNLEDYEKVICQTKEVYGELPQCVVNLCKIGLIKNLGQKIKASKIVLNDFTRRIIFYENVVDTKIFDFLVKNSVDYVLNNDKVPIIILKDEGNIQKQVEKLIKFLIQCVEILNK